MRPAGDRGGGGAVHMGGGAVEAIAFLPSRRVAVETFEPRSANCKRALLGHAGAPLDQAALSLVCHVAFGNAPQDGVRNAQGH
jgi:hypothetical protein